ncbi:MAG: hypothetical protein ACYDHE_19705 [Candidatus Acidiferrales bacterium]
MPKKPDVKGYQVQMKVESTGTYVGYTSAKRPLTREMAQSLADHLKRGNEKGNTGGRIIDLATGEVVEEWNATIHPVHGLPEP